MTDNLINLVDFPIVLTVGEYENAVAEVIDRGRSGSYSDKAVMETVYDLGTLMEQGLVSDNYIHMLEARLSEVGEFEDWDAKLFFRALTSYKSMTSLRERLLDIYRGCDDEYIRGLLKQTIPSKVLEDFS